MALRNFASATQKLALANPRHALAACRFFVHGWEQAAPGGTVLLAPACASFDMFADYAERGRVFKQEVRRLAEELNTTREQ
jgi:UDP-N-acetylmuramoylalanine-D-glutamate ligase